MPAYRQDAINQCLDAIGEAPVNSTQSGVPDAEDASRMIDKVTRQVLSAGWTVNSVYNKLITPDHDGIIRVADNVLRIDTAGRSAGIAVTVRNDLDDGIDKLFKVLDESFIFTDPVYVDIVYFFDIDGLPFPLQNYIAAMSARVFQESVMGSATLDAFVKRAEAEAWAMVLDYEADQDDANALTDSPYMRAVTGRNNPLTGR
ncbi:MAG: hypothetical protein P4M09_17285 [Devosia sp.]|nr:hypothetical protein [Devosia sp.]